MIQFKPSQRRSFFESFLRGIGLAVVIMLVAYLFWNHYDRSLDTIQSRQAIWDQTGTLTSAQKQSLYSIVQDFKDRFGVEIEVRITSGVEVVPKTRVKKIMIVISPPHRNAQVILPPLVEKALDPSFVTYLREKHFDTYWDKDMSWLLGLDSGLNLLWENLQKLEE